MGLTAVALATMGTLALGFEITSVIQAELEKQKKVIAAWAAEPGIIAAVKEQNSRGPIPDMDNAKWKTIRRSDPIVKAFQTNPAGQLLRTKVDGSGGVFSEAFLNAARGEKVGFAEKTTSYIHAGQPKYDVPFTSGKAWQGKAEFDESAQTHQIQISVPVLAEGKPIGVLVVGVNLAHIERLTKN